MALLRMISPANRGPQRAAARKQHIGNRLPQESMAPRPRSKISDPPDKHMKRSDSLDLFTYLRGRALAA